MLIEGNSRGIKTRTKTKPQMFLFFYLLLSRKQELFLPGGHWTRREMDPVSHLSPARAPDRDGPRRLQEMRFPLGFHLVF